MQEFSAEIHGLAELSRELRFWLIAGLEKLSHKSMRVDLSPRLGGHTCVPPNRGERSTASRVANQPPHYCPPLIHLHSPPAGTV